MKVIYIDLIYIIQMKQLVILHFLEMVVYKKFLTELD